MANNYFLPGFSGQVSADSEEAAYEQRSPLLNLYSPRLFGSPPQLTHQCDMRILSSNGDHPGPVGDFYLNNVLRESQVANFIVGHALFNGGMNTIWNMIRTAGQYAYAIKRYKIFDNNEDIRNTGSVDAALNEYDMEAYTKAMGEDDGQIPMKRASELQVEGANDDAYMLDIEAMEGASSIIDGISSMFGTLGVITAPIKDSMRMQQSYYTFEADWYSYINNVKMMINAAIMMLGIQDAQVRIGDQMYNIGVGANVQPNTDLWTMYRFITPTSDERIGTVNAIDTMSGDNTQYVSFMVEPSSVSENFSNTTGQSQIYSTVINQGSQLGNEIAFITNTSRNSIDDALLNLTGQAVNMAEAIMSNLTLGTGRFTAAILGSMARSYTGDHTIFPDIFQSHTSTSSVNLSIKLRANAGDPYSYFIDILVPLFHLVAMAIPQMSKNAASAYSYPPLIQLNIPGMWGTRLGMIQQLQITKNSDGNSVSINGYPLSVDVNVTVVDLQHVVMSSGMDQPKMFLNNNTMFDYIAQCAGVDKYRINGSIRLVTKIALAASAGSNKLYNLGRAVMSDYSAIVNKLSGIRNS